jgi:hypothetical protein
MWISLNDGRESSSLRQHSHIRSYTSLGQIGGLHRNTWKSVKIRAQKGEHFLGCVKDLMNLKGIFSPLFKQRNDNAIFKRI